MILQYLLHDPVTTIISVIVGLFTFGLVQVIRFYIRVKSYPPGPLPLPFVGNVLLFLRKKSGPNGTQPHRVITDLHVKHGPVFTFWMGSSFPQVVITKPELIKDAMTRYQFGGRLDFGSMNKIIFGDGIDVVFADWGREWEVLRKVSHSAVRKFAVNEKLPIMVDAAVKNFISEINEIKGRPFNPEEHIAFLMLSLLANISYGKNYTRDDEDFRNMRMIMEQQTQSNTGGIMLFFPILRFIWRKEWQIMMNMLDTQASFQRRQLEEHLETFKEGVVRDFTDAMISAMKEAEQEDSNDVKYLKQRNITNTLNDLFSAGSDTTKMTVQWILLFLAVHLDHQRAIRKEVESAMGCDQIVSPHHKAQCHLLQAFICESMRIRPIVPTNVPHKTIEDVQVGGFTIKKGTTVILPVEPLLISDQVWPETDTFNVNRFLSDDGIFNPRPNGYFLPFGAGRRSCLGEKLATANTFMIVAGILHHTRGSLLLLAEESKDVPLTPDPERDLNSRPRKHKLILREE